MTDFSTPNFPTASVASRGGLGSLLKQALNHLGNKIASSLCDADKRARDIRDYNQLLEMDDYTYRDLGISRGDVVEALATTRKRR